MSTGFRRIVLVVIGGSLLLAAAPAAAPAAVTTKVMRYGPVHMDGFETRLPKTRIPSPGVDGWLTHMNVRLVDSRGRRVSIRHVMLHHIVFINDGRHKSEYRGSCEGRHGEPFYGTGEEREQLILPEGYGYQLHHDDRWRLQTMLMSHNLRPMNVYVEWTMRIVTGERRTPVRPFWIRANGCKSDQPSYTVPGGGAPGSTHSLSWTWNVPMTGRIVAAGGHLHGGAKDMVLSDPVCGRDLLDTRPIYAPASDLVYTLRPVLHEPGPVSTRYFLSAAGIPVRRGQKLRITGLYDNEYPRARVMSIMHVYVAPSRSAPAQSCPPLPADRREVRLRRDGSFDPPYVPIPFNVLGDDGTSIQQIDHLPGNASVFGGPATVALRDNQFVPAKISIPAGASIRYRWQDPVRHNVLYASGPVVVGTPTLQRGTIERRFTAPGTYQLFCYLHPITMHQEVIVRPAGT
jgi:plastocyanin